MRLGSAFITPGTSFQMVTELASRQYAKMAALKSDPSLPRVVVDPSGPESGYFILLIVNKF